VKLLLHICCAPCAVYTFQEVKDAGFEISAFYYNPNIHPFMEYRLRKTSVEKLSQLFSFPIVYPDYSIEEFWRRVAFSEKAPQRCEICWEMRLLATAVHARENNCHAISTTLLISPYQNHEAIKHIGESIAQQHGLEFYYQDFRKGFRQSQQKSREMGLYMQKYCGCLYSERDRYYKKS
jgi:hypothetical protein